MAKKKALIIVGVMVALILLSSAVGYAVSPGQQAKIAAEEELPKLKEFISDVYKDFHFNSLDDLKKAYTGDPIRNFAIYEYDESKSLEEQMEEMPFYVFPVMVDGVAVTDVTVRLVNKEWKVVDIGGHLSVLLQEAQVNKGLTDIKVLRCSGGPYVLGRQGKVQVGFSPYQDVPEMGFGKCELINMEKVKEAIEFRIAEMKEMYGQVKDSNGDPSKVLILSPEGGPPHKVEFVQDSMINRLISYCRHMLNKIM